MHPLRLLVATAVAVAVALLASAASAAPLAAAPPDAPPGAWLLPVDGPLVRPFEEPVSRYGPGH
ncbi:MAG: M23 family peptidase, partial [Acidimicrobiia bacterium]